MDKIVYVLVSEGIEIYRSSDYDEVLYISIALTADWYIYKSGCIGYFMPYADNEIFFVF